jgi:hypothetical protein
VLACCVACQTAPPDETPERVVEAFIERMSAVHGDPERGRSAVALIARKGRENLEQRAERASAAAGRQMSSEEMLAPSRFVLSFTPKAYTSEIEGDYARVYVKGDNATEVAEVHCVLEDQRWRVILDLPELPVIQKRGE